MSNEEIHPLVYKAMLVVLSCKTEEQLNVAISYANLVYKRLSKDTGLLNSSKFSPLINKSIGFSLCKLNKHLQKF